MPSIYLPHYSSLHNSLSTAPLLLLPSLLTLSLHPLLHPTPPLTTTTPLPIYTPTSPPLFLLHIMCKCAFKFAGPWPRACETLSRSGFRIGNDNKPKQTN